jgi:hypothetical protein
MLVYELLLLMSFLNLFYLQNVPTSYYYLNALYPIKSLLYSLKIFLQHIFILKLNPKSFTQFLIEAFLLFWLQFNAHFQCINSNKAQENANKHHICFKKYDIIHYNFINNDMPIIKYLSILFLLLRL